MSDLFLPVALLVALVGALLAAAGLPALNRWLTVTRLAALLALALLAGLGLVLAGGVMSLSQAKE
jgi:hypothetical protein